MTTEDFIIKDCPFCGNTAELIHSKSWVYRVKCPGCGCQTRGFTDNAAGAVITWNRRIQEAVPERERIIELVEELSDLVGGVSDDHR